MKRILAIFILILLAIGAIWLFVNFDYYFGGGKQDLQASLSLISVCVYLESENQVQHCDQDYLLATYPDAVKQCLNEQGQIISGNAITRNAWIECLRQAGVDFESPNE